jgi:hypothetical protein
MILTKGLINSINLNRMPPPPTLTTPAMLTYIELSTN